MVLKNGVKNIQTPGYNGACTVLKRKKKSAGISGLWVLNEIIQKIYHENMKKIMGAVWKLPVNCKSSPFSPELGWIGCAI